MASDFESAKPEKIVAIHQPNYFPWLGYFYKIYACDVFVFHDNVEHSKRYPTRRTLISDAKNQIKSIWLTVPLKQHSDYALIKELEFQHDQGWQGKHLRKLRNSYIHAPFYSTVFPIIESWLEPSHRIRLLADMNIYFIKKILESLGIEKPLFRSSHLSTDGIGSSHNISIVKSLGGNAYLSGTGASDYQTENEFSEAGIELKYSNFLTDFRQQYPGLSFNKSILDTLFQLGFEGVKNCLESCHQK